MLKAVTKKKGVVTLEYIILVTAVIGLLVVFLVYPGIFTRALERSLSVTTNSMLDMSKKFEFKNIVAATTGTGAEPPAPAIVPIAVGSGL